MSVHNIGGAEVNLQIPEDAVVTGAIIIATYQRMDGHDVGAGTVWGYSAIPHVQAVAPATLSNSKGTTHEPPPSPPDPVRDPCRP